MNTEMKLSEAIRLGSMMKPQGYGSSTHGRDGQQVSCALRAACDAVGIASLINTPFGGDLIDYTALTRRFPILTRIATLPPFTGRCYITAWAGAEVELCSAIWMLNDTYRWSREKIADWVERFETVAEPVAVLTTAA